MSCYWDAIIRELSEQEAARAGLAGIKDPVVFATKLKEAGANCFVLSKWQGAALSEQQRRENAAAVAAYNTDTVRDGYYCGSCDPFLLLVAHVAGVNIHHETPTGTFDYSSQYPAARWITLRSNSRHMH